MQLAERPQFRAELERLGRVFDRQVTDELLGDYWDALRDMPLEQLRARVSTTVRVAKFFPKPRELRENPDGERRAVDTRGPAVDVDDWTVTLNRILRDVLMTVGGVPNEAVAALVAEKRRLAVQMGEANPPKDEWAEMAPAVTNRLLDMARKARTDAGWEPTASIFGRVAV